MEADSWSTSRLSAASKCFKSRSDLYLGEDDVDRHDDPAVEFLCPFCGEDFDMVGLYCHIDDEHPIELKNGVCPVCSKRVGMDIVGHIMAQHGSIFKVPRKRRYRKGGSNLTFSLLRKELREGNLQSLFRGSTHTVPSTNAEPDPLLSSFVYNLPKANESASVELHSSVGPSSVKESSDEYYLERNVKQPVLSDEDQEEKARKCNFVHELVLSTMFDDYL